MQHRKPPTKPSEPETFSPLVLVNTEKALSEKESESLRECEKIIAEHLEAFLQVGQALLTVKNQKLYRSEFGTFEEYCSKKWGYTRTYAYRLINGAEVVRQLSPIGDSIPKNECQVRPLTGLPPKVVKKVWAKAVELAGTGEITGQIVKLAVGRVVKKPKKKSEGREMWQSQILPLLQKAIIATRNKSREEVDALVEKIRLLLSIGNHHSPEIEQR